VWCEQVCEPMFRKLTGSEFQAAGPATASELSAKRVLVRRTMKLPRVDDRRRLSLQRLQISVRSQTSAKAAHYVGLLSYNLQTEADNIAGSRECMWNSIKHSMEWFTVVKITSKIPGAGFRSGLPPKSNGFFRCPRAPPFYRILRNSVE